MTSSKLLIKSVLNASIVFVLIGWLVCLCGQKIYAQEVSNEELSPEDFLKRVSDIESFIKRFNFEEDIINTTIRPSEAGSIDEQYIKNRTQQILSLFDQNAI